MRAIAFDAIETCLSLEPLRPPLVELGLQPDDLELWFARSLRDAFAVEAADSFVPFDQILESSLSALLEERKLPVPRRKLRSVIAGFGRLPFHPDVRPAFERVRRAGLKLAVVTNGSRATTRRALLHGGLVSYVDAIVSVEEVRHYKPAAEVYRFAAREAGVKPSQMGLVTAHAWDAQGAIKAGLAAAFVQRKEGFSRALGEPTAAGKTQTEALSALGVPDVKPSRMRKLVAVAELAAAGVATAALVRAMNA
jgi:2-haloacid dehalogenase